MSYADKLFVKMCEDVLKENNVNQCRAVWKDTGKKSSTISKFAVVNRYDLKKEFPILTIRPVPIKSAIDEILWIYQKKSNDIHLLSSHIWDAWADENGSIGKAYGYQMSVKHHYPEGDFDQVDRVLYDLKHNPASRRILLNMYNQNETTGQENRLHLQQSHHK